MPMPSAAGLPGRKREPMLPDEFALFGAPPRFEEPVLVGQLYFPAWDRYTEAMRGIFERQYYTNQGPLTDALEDALQRCVGVKHAMCVTNATIGLIMAAQAMRLTGKVIAPAFMSSATAQSMRWAGLEPVFCDVDLATQQVTPEGLAPLVGPEVSGILAVNLWGGSCDPARLVGWADARGLPVYFDSTHAFGCRSGGVAVGGFGQVEVFSFHSARILNATEGGCVCTNDDALAARLRNIRSSYGARHPVEVVKTANGRMSEAQAAMALMSLEDLSANREHNVRLLRTYERALAEVPGIELVQPSNVTYSNHESLVCRCDAAAFGLSRDTLLRALRAENVLARRDFHPGAHRSVPDAGSPRAAGLPNTEALCRTGIQLPLGAQVTGETVARIGDLLRRIQSAAPAISSRAGDRHA